MDDLQSLELLSLVSKVTSELQNHLGMSDKTLAEFIIAQHDQCKSLPEFKEKLDEMGAEFPNSLIESIDRLVLTLHPKYKSSNAAKENGKEEDGADDMDVLGELERKSRVFKGLAIPDKQVEFEEVEPQDAPAELEADAMDDTFAMLESLAGKAKKRSASPSYDEHERSHSKRHRRSRSRSRSPYRKSRKSKADTDSYVFEDEFGRTRTVPRKDEHRSGRRRRRNSSSDDEFRKPPIPEADPEPILYKVYHGRVTGIKDFGAFVNLQGVRGKVDGLVHVSAMAEGTRVNHPTDIVSRNQEVKVKVMKMENGRISLSMKEVDQLSGRDLNPQKRIFASGANSESLGGGSNDRNGTGGFSGYGGGSDVPVDEGEMDPRSLRNRKRLTSPERWEIKQLVSYPQSISSHVDDQLLIRVLDCCRCT